MTRPIAFAPRDSVEAVEEGLTLAPRFGADGLMPCVTVDAVSGAVLMLGWMDEAALRLTLNTGEAHYWSRSRRAIWRKGAVSGLTQRVVEARIDDDQDALLLRVAVSGSGASCHVGYRSCFYRRIEADGALAFVETDKLFDPKTAYGDLPNPTQL
ncbi:phosphoribosyl-AMP cyclohydrolase [Rubrimonas sp.]|uniref:phosphoribosyl-AMP cyclohydrolase n=1 Tax=Rubrimonas sp. TaxID=2036015 RepID=UPI002FDDCAF8